MMDDSTDAVLIPRETVIVTPNAEPLYIYQEANGHKLISVKITDNRVDDVQLMLTPEVARHMALNLLAMLDNLDQLHTQWTDTHHD